jgi:hypothetical protein
MNLELFLLKPAKSAKGKASTKNVRFQGEVSLKQIKGNLTEQSSQGFKLSGISIWAGPSEIQEELIQSAVKLAKELGLNHPVWSKREVECADKDTGEMFTREVLRIKQGLSIRF